MPSSPPPDSRQGSAEHLVAHLLASARHDMLTPLAVIQGSTQLLQRRLGRLDGVSEADLASLNRLGLAIERSCRELVAVVDHLDEADPRFSERDDSPPPQERGDGDE